MQEKMPFSQRAGGKRRCRGMVNYELQTYLTDFQDARFAAWNAKNCAFCGGKILQSTPVYLVSINHAPAPR